MPPKRRGFYDQAPVDTGLDVLRERNVEALMQPLMQPRRTVQRDVPIDRIRPNPFQARHVFSGIEELAQAIRTHGFVSHLRVRPHPTDSGYFQLAYGERRWRAAQAAGLTEIPCEIAEHTDPELLEIGLLENIQRDDLDPLEEAQAFHTMIEQRGYSIRRLAERIGKDKGYVENRIALLDIPEDVRNLVARRPDTIRAARIIAQVPSPVQRHPLIEGIASGTLTHQDIVARVRALSSEQAVGDGNSVGGSKVDHASDQRVTGDADEQLGLHPLPDAAGGAATQTSQANQSAFSRALDRDTQHLTSMLARWRLAGPRSRPEDRARILAFIQDQALPQFGHLVSLLQESHEN